MMSHFLSRAAAVFGLLFATASAPAQQAAAEETVMPGVEVRHVKDPGLMPYRKAYDIISRVNAAAQGKVELRLKVLSTAKHEPLPDLEVRLSGTRDFGAIGIQPDGTLDFPMDEDAAKDDADLISNQKKGTLEVTATFVPIFKTDAPLSYGDIQAAIEAARRVRKEIMPWYWRAVTPNIGTLSLCYPRPTEVLRLTSASGEATRNADRESDGLQANKVYCAHFTSSEKALPADTLITGPDAWEAHFGAAWF
jgi:hypothetical protein